MALIDAYALVALIADEPAAAEIDGLLRSRDAGMTVVNFAEALDVLQRRYRLSVEEIRQALEPLVLGGVLSVVGSDENDAWLAASLRANHYNRKTRAVSLADCFLLAHAVAGQDEIATSDSPLAAAARVEGVGIVPLPSTVGKRPTV